MVEVKSRLRQVWVRVKARTPPKTWLSQTLPDLQDLSQSRQKPHRVAFAM